MANKSIESAFERMWQHITSHSVQPDWNQNDESADDYIKNRPFYTGDIVETFIVEETNITLEEGGDNTGVITASQPLEVGQEYTVTFNGNKYTVVCKKNDMIGNYMGNLSIVEMGENTEEPFFIGPWDSETEFGIMTNTGA